MIACLRPQLVYRLAYVPCESVGVIRRGQGDHEIGLGQLRQEAVDLTNGSSGKVLKRAQRDVPYFSSRREKVDILDPPLLLYLGGGLFLSSSTLPTALL